MSGVVNIADARARAARAPHCSGPAICLGCKHEWVAAVPSEQSQEDLECPACHVLRGVWKRNFGPVNAEPRYVCSHCSSQYFYVLTAGVLCVGCGVTTPFTKLAEIAP